MRRDDAMKKPSNKSSFSVAAMKVLLKQFFARCPFTVAVEIAAVNALKKRGQTTEHVDLPIVSIQLCPKRKLESMIAKSRAIDVKMNY
jgi:hypothetical protein